MAASGPRRDAAVFGAVDVGASKIACLVAHAHGEAGDDRPIDMLGASAVAVRPDIEPEARPRLIQVAVDQALRMSGDANPPFASAFGGPDLVSVRTLGHARIRKGIVSARDVAGAIASARAEARLNGRRLLHAAPIAYSIDDADAVIDPRDIEGQVLAAEVCLTHAPEDAVAALEAALVGAGVRPAFVIAAPFAAGHGVLTPEEREEGAVLIDLGEAVAGVAVFRCGGLVHAETIAGGGQRLTRDLAARLNTSLPAAERAKRLHGALTGDQDASEAIEIPVLGPDGRLEPGVVLRGAFFEALTPRLEEIFTRIAARLAAADAPGLPVALAGGVSQTPGIRALAARILKRPVRIALPGGFAGFDAAASGGGFAVAAGLIRCGLERHADAPAAPAPQRQPAVAPPPTPAPAQQRTTGRVGNAVAWIKENF